MPSTATNSAPEAAAGEPYGPLAQLRAWVGLHLGIRFEDDTSELLARRIAMAFGAGEAVLREVLEATLRGDHRVIARLAEATSTNHTFFFREPDTFDTLAREILPALPKHEPLRLWSAAASSGEETYSMAIVADAVLGADADRAHILGTDISERQLRCAERGVYERAALALVPTALRGAFVDEGNEHVRVHPRIARRCIFRRLNLVARPWPFANRFHVIFLRNVLYYFAPSVREQVIDACYEVAAPGAWLVVGLSEPLIDVQSRWTEVGPGLLRKRGTR